MSAVSGIHGASWNVCPTDKQGLLYSSHHRELSIEGGASDVPWEGREMSAAK